MVIPNIQIGTFPQPKMADTSGFMDKYKPVMITFCFLPFLNFVAALVVTEKENRVKDMMLLMGLSRTAYWVGWMVTYALMSTLLSFVFVIIVATFKYFLNINFILLFILIDLYGFSIMMLGFTLIPFFKQHRVSEGKNYFFSLL